MARAKSIEPRSEEGGKRCMKKKDVCCVCNEFKEMSFEHIPPVKAFNSNPVFLKKFEHLSDKSSPLYGKQIRSNKGMGGFLTCVSCNNNTGDWYARSYINWAAQAMDIIEKYGYHKRMLCQFYFSPLDVLKQVIVMLMCCDKLGELRNDLELSNFILNRDNTLLPDKYKIYMYLNNSSLHRMLGFSVVAGPDLPVICKWAEFNFRPFGFLLAIDSPPAHQSQFDITFFKNYKYRQNESLRLPLSYLDVPDTEIGKYRTV